MYFINSSKIGIVFLSIVSQLVLSEMTVNAEIQLEQYSPGAPDSTIKRNGGTRGECSEVGNPINLIVPEDQQHQGYRRATYYKTTSPRPTLAWYMQGSSDYPVKFTLVEPGKTLYRQELVFKNGLVTLTLPETAPALEIGKKYRWTVSILCDRQHPSRNPFAQAFIQRVSLPSNLKIEENVSCNIYKKAGIWYDSVACSLKNQFEANF